MRIFLTKLCIALISFLLCLMAAEYTFRAILFSDIEVFDNLRKAEYYSDHPKYNGEDFFNDDYWKLRHLFNPFYDFEIRHLSLGWIGNFYAFELDHHDENELKERRPVLLFGDSFAHCIDSTLCFEEFLNNDSSFTKDHYFLNYGVGGYGVDQIALLTEKVIDRFDNPFVIFSLLTTDMDRSMLSIRDAQKPYFEIENNKLILKGTPLFPNSKAYLEENPPQVNSYLWRRFKSSDLNPLVSDSLRSIEYMEYSKKLNGAILKRVIERLRKQEVDVAFLIFHPSNLSFDNWRLEYVRDLLIDEHVPFIVDATLRHQKDPLFREHKDRYIIKNDGHPTSTSNAMIADELKRIVLDSLYSKRLLTLN